MSHSPPPPPATPLACQRDPERWFNRRHRAAALAGCLSCAVRPWCAGQALKYRATHGMWAGIWIDGHHHDAVPHLQAIAVREPSPIDERHAADDIATVLQQSAPAALPPRPTAPLPARSAAAAVLARSSGHCEVLSEGCRYTFDQVVSRRHGQAGIETHSCAELFAACVVCAELVARLNPQLASRSGYVVNPGRDPASVPFYWRGSRWVLLARDGWLTENGDDAQTA